MENENINTPEEIIVRYFTGEASKEEVALVIDKIKSDKEWNAIYQRTLKIFNAASASQIDENIDVDKAIKSFLKKTETEQKKSKSIPINTKRLVYTFLKIAAALVIVILIFKWFDKSVEVKYLSKEVAIEGIILPDSSVVDLAPNSSLRCTKVFKSKTREIHLIGNAYFNVAHDASKPFIISCGDVYIKVLGTAFWVYEFRGKACVSVKVKEGKVKVYPKVIKQSALKDTVVLTAGDSATWNNEKKSFFIKKALVNNSSSIIFSNTPLIKVIEELSAAYHVKIVIRNPQIEQCKITLNIENASLESVFEMLKTILPISISKENDEYVISGKGC